MSQPPLPDTAIETNTLHLTAEQYAQLDVGFGALIETIIASPFKESLRASQGKLHAIFPPIPDCIEHGYACLHPRPEKIPQIDEAICLRFFEVSAERIRNWIATSDAHDGFCAEYLAQRIREEYMDNGAQNLTESLSTPALLQVTQSLSRLPLQHRELFDCLFLRVGQRLEHAEPTTLSEVAKTMASMTLSERLGLVHVLPLLIRFLTNVEQISVDRIEQGRAEAALALSDLLTRLDGGQGSELLSILTHAAKRKMLIAQLPVHQRDGITLPIQETGSLRMQEEHEHLSRRVRLSETLKADERLVRISSDAIGIMTPTGVLRAIGTCDLASATPPAPFAAHQLDEAMLSLAEHRFTPRLFMLIEEEVISQAGDTDAVTRFWESVLEQSDQSSRACLEQLRQTRMAYREEQQTVQAQALERLTQRVQSLQAIADRIEKLLPALRSDPVIGQYGDLLDRFADYCTVEVLDGDGRLIQRGIPHLALKVIHTLLEQMKIPADTSAALRRCFAFQDPDPTSAPLHATLVTLCNEALKTDHRQLNAPTVHAHDADKLSRNRLHVGDSLMALQSALEGTPAGTRLMERLHALAEQHIDTLPTVQFEETQRFLATTAFYPFSGDQKAEDIAAFVQLQSPEARNEIKKRLGIDPSELTLQSRFHFDRYVKEQPKETIDRTAATIGKYPAGSEVRTNLLTCFLACARNKDYGDWLLEIAEAEGGDEFFALYAQMVRDVDTILPRLEAMTTRAQIAEQHPPEVLYTKLLTRPNKLLKQVKKELDRQQPPRSIKSDLPELRQQFRHENDQVHIVRTALQVLAGNPRDAVIALGGMEKFIELMGSIDIAQMPAAQLKNETGTFDLVLRTLATQFSPEVTDVFRRHFTDQNAVMYLLRAAGEISSFFSQRPMGDNAYLVDWFATVPDSPLEGLGELALAAVLRRESGTKKFYAHAKPFVAAAFSNCIENVHMVAFDQTTDAEEDKSYLRLRSPEPYESYLGHTLSDAEIEQLISRCDAPGIHTDIPVRDTKVCLVRVDYKEDRTYKSVVDATSPDGLLFKEADTLFGKNGGVCTRVWRNTQYRSTAGKSFIYLFETSKLQKGDYNRWLTAVSDTYHLETPLAHAA